MWSAYCSSSKVLIGHLKTKSASSLAVRVTRGTPIRANKGGGANVQWASLESSSVIASECGPCSSNNSIPSV
jgi:hypothetical protein